MKISKHKLDTGSATFDEVKKTSGNFENGLPDTIVIHYTAGPSASSAMNTFKDPSVKVSVHVLIDEDGNLTQLIPFNKVAWHAGKSAWLDRNRLNPYSIGIEIVNAGRLEKCGDTWRSWFGKCYPENRVIRATHRNETTESWWHVYTEEQITATFELCKELAKTYDIRYILGHEEISPGRKCDPGPAFPLDKIRERLLHGNRSDDEQELQEFDTGTVTASALNIRSGPSAERDTIAEPLSRNTEVTVLNERNGWYNVEVKINGWVSKKYIHKKE